MGEPRCTGAHQELPQGQKDRRCHRTWAPRPGQCGPLPRKVVHVGTCCRSRWKCDRRKTAFHNPGMVFQGFWQRHRPALSSKWLAPLLGARIFPISAGAVVPQSILRGTCREQAALAIPWSRTACVLFDWALSELLEVHGMPPQARREERESPKGLLGHDLQADHNDLGRDQRPDLSRVLADGLDVH